MPKLRRKINERNKIEFRSWERHLIPVFPKEGVDPDDEIQSVYYAEGTSNGDEFGAVVLAPGWFRPKVEMYGKVRFEPQEIRSVGLKLMFAADIPSVEHPEIVTAEQAAALVEDLQAEGRKRYSGEKIFLEVPYADRELAQALGAKWSKEEGKWYVFSQLADLDDFKEWLPQDSAPEFYGRRGI